MDLTPPAGAGPVPPSAMDLTVLYRGPLSSCDFDCPYCPFAKRRDTPELLRADRAALERFTGWAAAQTGDRLRILFTPWGEGLVRSWYRRALVGLSRLPHVERVAIQTNLSCRTGWLSEADPESVALWCTYHPGQTPYERFLGKCRELAERGVRFSVGVVGLPEHAEDARRLRAALPSHVYLWVNAAEGHAYTDAEAAEWTRIDPLLGGAALPHRRVGDLGGRRGYGAALPLRQGRTGEPVRRLVPRRPAPPLLPPRRLRLSHRLRPPGDAAAVRRVRRRGPGADPRRRSPAGPPPG